QPVRVLQAYLHLLVGKLHALGEGEIRRRRRVTRWQQRTACEQAHHQYRNNTLFHLLLHFNVNRKQTSACSSSINTNSPPRLIADSRAMESPMPEPFNKPCRTILPC